MSTWTMVVIFFIYTSATFVAGIFFAGLMCASDRRSMMDSANRAAFEAFQLLAFVRRCRYESDMDLSDSGRMIQERAQKICNLLERFDEEAKSFMKEPEDKGGQA